MMKRFFLYLVPCTFLLLSACGFHLRGALALPEGVKKIYLTGVTPSQPLARDIAMLFAGNGGTVVEDRNEADAVLEILGEKNDRRVAAVNSEGRVSQYELYYELSFRMLDPKGEIVHPAATVGVTRDYAFDPNNVLGKAQEESLLRDDMRKQAVNQMLRRLARGTHLEHPTPAESPAQSPAESPTQGPAEVPPYAPAP